MVLDPQPPLPIVVVEDCHEDYESLVRVLKKGNISNPILRFEDIESALAYLRIPIESDAAVELFRPVVLLLDVDPLTNSKADHLSILRHEPCLDGIPIIALMSSADERDVARCYAAGADSHIQKAFDVQAFFDSIAVLAARRLNITITKSDSPEQGIALRSQ